MANAEQFVLTVSAFGFGKRASTFDFRTSRRGGKGIKATDQGKLDEIGERIAESVVDFFQEEENRLIVARLKEYGLQFSLSEAELENQTEILKGMTFVVSGVFESVSRNELKKMIEDNGGKVSSSISSKTSFVVAGDNMGQGPNFSANPS